MESCSLGLRTRVRARESSPTKPGEHRTDSRRTVEKTPASVRDRPPACQDHRPIPLGTSREGDNGLVIEWEPVDLGCSEAVVRRRSDGAAYAKTATGLRGVADLAAERDRVAWLTTTPIPGPQLLDWQQAGSCATLVTSAVRGIPASAVPMDGARQVLPELASALAELHALPVGDCPFDHRLEVTCAAASTAVHLEEVDAADFDTERRGRQPRELFVELLSAKKEMADLEAGDLVVCHGDACLPNLLVDPDTLAFTGFIDLGRLGVADRHLDLALLHRSLEGGANPQFPAGSGDDALAAYGLAANPSRLAYYQLLDEFF